MRNKLLDVLKGKFLIADDAIKNWIMLLFLFFLALVMIASSHHAEKKVHTIARLHKDVQRLRTQFVDVRTRLMRLKMESSVVEKMAQRGVSRPELPPQKIIIKTKE